MKLTRIGFLGGLILTGAFAQTTSFTVSSLTVSGAVNSAGQVTGTGTATISPFATGAVAVTGTGAVALTTNDGGSGGALSFQLGASLSFASTANSLTINGAIFTLDLKTPNAACTPSGITLPSGFNQVGMGFSTDVAGGTTETLYLDGISGAGLAKVDMSTMAVTLIGNFSNDPTLESQSAELTGTGNALLYGYFVDSDSNDVYVAGIDKTDSKILSSYKLPGVMAPSDWAFSFWGGDFYLYASDGVNDSNVIQYDPTTKTVNQSFIADVGMWPQTMGMMIIGAGSTTCAPIMPPM